MNRRFLLTAAAATLAAGVAPAARAADIVQAAQSAGTFTMLLRAVQAAGLEAAMHAPGPYTVFAPNDAAFAAAPQAMLRHLMDPANVVQLRMVLGYHVLAGRLTSRDVRGMTRAADTLGGAPIIINGMGDTIHVNDANVLMADMQVDNGVVHVIDHVLMPPMPIQPRL